MEQVLERIGRAGQVLVTEKTKDYIVTQDRGGRRGSIAWPIAPATSAWARLIIGQDARSGEDKIPEGRGLKMNEVMRIPPPVLFIPPRGACSSLGFANAKTLTY